MRIDQTVHFATHGKNSSAYATTPALFFAFDVSWLVSINTDAFFFERDPFLFISYISGAIPGTKYKLHLLRFFLSTGCVLHDELYFWCVIFLYSLAGSVLIKSCTICIRHWSGYQLAVCFGALIQLTRNSWHKRIWFSYVTILSLLFAKMYYLLLRVWN